MIFILCIFLPCLNLCNEYIAFHKNTTKSYFQKNKRNNAHVAIWMDLEIIIISEVNPESKKKKKDINEFYLQNRKRLTDLENKCIITKGER